MIIAIEKYNATSPSSKQTILCKCDACGKQSFVRKYSLLRRKNGYQYCQPCSSTQIVSQKLRGIVRSAEHKKRTGAASIARNSGAKLVRYNKDNPRVGLANYRYNPDRELINNINRARKESYCLLHNTLKRLGISKTTRTEIMLGYTKEELISHIESRFTEGMSWSNRGEWHIDHIKPVSSFIQDGIFDTTIINALSNLQPLWASENCSKGNRVTL